MHLSTKTLEIEMLPEQIKKTKTNASQQISNELDDYIVRIDYFDKKGTKNFENSVPLMHILNPVMDLHK